MIQWSACPNCEGAGFVFENEAGSPLMVQKLCLVAPSGLRALPLTKGKTAIIDEADFESCSAFKWSATNCRAGHGGGAPEKWYAIRESFGDRVYLHRFVLGYSGKKVVDHLDGNGLNCSRANLQIITQKRNIRRIYDGKGNP